MCGICGIIERRGRPIPETTLMRLRDSIDHRGPDDAGIYLSEGVGLGSRRLAILDLSPRGHMPMPNEDQTLWVTYNGEIYNYPELRRELETKGARFRSDCDTEVLLHAYDAWGDGFVERLHGMFAFAIWDTQSRRLFAARDRLGVKPFFYIDDGERFAFCSELAGLYEIDRPTFDRIDPLSLDFYLGFGYLPPNRSMIQGVHKLPPAHTLVVDETGIRLRRYWQAKMSASNQESVEEIFEQLDQVLRNAVAKRLRSDVPLGCFLSGGIDSGLVTALAAEASDRPINTFSVGFSDTPPENDERPLARLVAERFGTRHEELVVEPASHQLLPEILRHVGEPFADVGILPMYQISKAAREHITVALSGDGGDESFAGYPNVLAAARAERIRARVPLAGTRALESLVSLPGMSALSPRISMVSRFLNRYVNRGVVGQFDASNYWNESWRMKLYSDRALDGLTDVRARMIVAEITGLQPDLRWPDQNILVDLHLRLGGGYLTKVDIASNMASLEVRSPFLDHELVDFSTSIPLEQKLLGGRQKGLLREYAKRILPREIVAQPKRGFAPSLDAWLRGSWAGLVDDLNRRSIFVSKGLFREDTVRMVVEDHLRSRRSHGQRLFNLICLDLWAKTILD